MVSQRLRKVLRFLPIDNEGALNELSAAGAEVVGVTGCGIMLMTDDVHRGSLRATDDVSAAVEDLQFELNEGPCVEAYARQRPVLEPDLASPTVARWPAFTPRAVEAGVGAIFGFPLSVGQVRLGALDLYRSTPGALGGEQQADARRLAAFIAIEMLGLQSGAASGEVAQGLRTGADLRDRVHQATGMVAVQMGVGVAQALRVLRAYTIANSIPLREVADEVVARRLRFSPSGYGVSGGDEAR
jgi:hypothetical protein